MIKNTLLLDALEGKKVSRPPVWMMRQAGRFLPEFRELREKYDFFTRCKTPELASEITLMPIKRFPLDAAILFSDILVVPQAMGLNFEMKESFGPYLEKPIRNKEDIDRLEKVDVEKSLGYVYEAIRLTKDKLNKKIPLLGFAGAPWTILCYVVEGKGSKNFDIAKSFCFKHREWAHILLQKITDFTIKYLLKKVESGCDAIQIFDSWAGVLSPMDYNEFSLKYIEQIVAELSKVTKVIVFGKGSWHALKKMSEMNISALGVDWTISPKIAREFTNNKITLQGNFDPVKLLSTPKIIREETKKMISDFGVEKYIVNLGHGILPNTPIENAEAFIDTVINFVKA